MLRVKIIGQVTDSNRNKIYIEINDDEIEEMIKSKAKERGIVGCKGRIFDHLDETIIGVSIEE